MPRPGRIQFAVGFVFSSQGCVALVTDLATAREDEPPRGDQEGDAYSHLAAWAHSLTQGRRFPSLWLSTQYSAWFVLCLRAHKFSVKRL